MENTLLITDRLFIIASAFFKVDNTEWLNDKELIYEDDEEEIINRFEQNLSKVLNIIKEYLVLIISFLIRYGKILLLRFVVKDKKSDSVEMTGKRTVNYDYFAFDNNGAMKNYNGFYSISKDFKNQGGGGNDNGEPKGFIERIVLFLKDMYSSRNAETEPYTMPTRRMYRGNSLQRNDE